MSYMRAPACLTPPKGLLQAKLQSSALSTHQPCQCLSCKQSCCLCSNECESTPEHQGLSARAQHYAAELCWVGGTEPALCAAPIPGCSRGPCAGQPRRVLGTRSSAQGCPTQFSRSCSKTGSTITTSAGLTPVLRVPHP